MSSDLEKKIQEAFAEVPQPPEDDLCASFGDEALEDTEPFKGKEWQELRDVELLDEFQYALFWFTPEAFRYYLPAFLLGGFQKPNAVFVLTILQLLWPGDDEESAVFRKQRWGLLSEEQRAALQEWLSWLLANHTTRESVFESEVKEALDCVTKRIWWTDS